LSFAQFEREVTGERIRDKIAASKQKGMWMGGMPPLGYECRDHKLIVIPDEAETVRHIFRRYAALGSVRLLKAELDAAGIRSKSWLSSSGRSWGGKPLARGALYHMLRNPIYRGRIVHKDQHYPGEHEPIIDEPLWDEVQSKLAGNAVERRRGDAAASPSLLAGLLYDGEGHRMTPSHAVKNGMRYRYYVSQPLVRATRGTSPEGLRIAAGEIERIVLTTIGERISDPGWLAEALAPLIGTAGEQQLVFQRATGLAASWTENSAAALRRALTILCGRLTVHRERIDIEISATGLHALLSGKPEGSDPVATANGRQLLLSISARLCRIGQGKRLVIDAAARPGISGNPDPKLVKLLVRAHRFKAQLRGSPGTRISDFATREKLSPSYVALLLRLTLLAPDITSAILEGRHPAGFTAQKLVTHAGLPLAWSEQRQVLGFA
jgi:site-specific DNA recombinase